MATNNRAQCRPNLTLDQEGNMHVPTGIFKVAEQSPSARRRVEFVRADRVAAQGDTPVLRLNCTCRFNVSWGMACEHIFAFLNANQVRSLENI